MLSVDMMAKTTIDMTAKTTFNPKKTANDVQSVAASATAKDLQHKLCQIP
jgi:hypothetical protein